MQCVVCDEELSPGKNAFSAFLGGALCPRCGPNEPSSHPIDTDVLKVLRNLQRAGLPGSAHFRVPEVVMRDVERILRDLVERHTERRLRTPDLLARLRVDPSRTGYPFAPGSPAADDAAPPDSAAQPGPADHDDPGLRPGASNHVEPGVRPGPANHDTPEPANLAAPSLPGATP
jgi:hypothetical protein